MQRVRAEESPRQDGRIDGRAQNAPGACIRGWGFLQQAPRRDRPRRTHRQHEGRDGRQQDRMIAIVRSRDPKQQREREIDQRAGERPVGEFGFCAPCQGKTNLRLQV